MCTCMHVLGGVYIHVTDIMQECLIRTEEISYCDDHRYEWSDCAKTHKLLKPFVHDGVEDFVTKEKKSCYNSEFVVRLPSSHYIIIIIY